MEKPKTPLLFIIMSGFGVYPQQDFFRYTPNLNKFIENYPATVVKAVDPKLGRLDSKSGHQIMGAGRSVLPIQERISSDIDEGVFFDKEQVQNITKQLKENDSDLHLFASLLDYSDAKHILALAKTAPEGTDVHIHLSTNTDNLDTVQARQRLRTINSESVDGVNVASIVNQEHIRRSQDWDRLKEVVSVFLNEEKGAPKSFDNPVKFSKKNSKFSVASIEGKNITIGPEDAVVFADHNGKNMRYLAKAFSLPVFKFERKEPELDVSTLVEYEKDIPAEIIYSRSIFHDNLTEVVVKDGFLPYYITESIKSPYLNYYFKGNIMDKFKDEEVETVSSLNVQSFSERPAMASKEISRKLLEKLQQGKHDIYIAEFPNFEKMNSNKEKKKALKKLDGTIGKLVENVMVKGGVSIITSDYSQNLNQDQSNNNVPLLVISNELRGISFPQAKVPNSDLTLASPSGSLKDVAPTVLKLIDVDIPEKMETDGFNLDFNISP
ncbi:MAG: hypothetical protein ABEJ02_03040 [Candidatus Paceibacteria bacterium]